MGEKLETEILKHLWHVLFSKTKLGFFLTPAVSCFRVYTFIHVLLLIPVRGRVQTLATVKQ